MSLSTRCQTVVRRTFLGVGEHGVGFVKLGHAGRRIGLFAHVRVIFTRKLTKRLFDLVGIGRFADAENLVVVPELHADGLLKAL